MAFSRGVLDSLGNKHIRPVLQDWTFKGNPLTYMLLQNHSITLDGGRSIVLPGIIKEANAEHYTRGDLATLEVQDAENSAEAQWYWLRVNIALYETDIDRNEGETIINLLNAEKVRAKETMTETISDVVFGSNSSNTLISPGLQDMFGASGTSYLDLLDTDLTSPATWLTQILTPLSSNALAPHDMRRLRGVVTRGGSKPNLFACNFPVFNKIWSLAEADQRFGMADATNMGFDTVMFERCPIVADEHAPGSGYGSTDNWLMAMNMDHIKLAIHRNKNMAIRTYDPLPQQEAWIMKILLGYSFYTDNRRAHAVNKTFNPSS